ncbi:MAG: CvpA family protein, partial [Chitinispirillales bacterium]|nr:CvpA family protein [Chitinispirillales bacterium]
MSTFFDITILVIVLIFAVMGVKDGLVREIFRFGALLGGFFAGFCYYQDLGVHLKAVSSNPKAVSFTAFIIIF